MPFVSDAFYLVIDLALELFATIRIARWFISLHVQEVQELFYCFCTS